MRGSSRGSVQRLCVGFVVAAALVGTYGCGFANGPIQFLGSPFPTVGGNGGVTGPGGSGNFGGGGGLGSNNRAPVDPCTVAQNMKFVRISMQNASEDFIHYFLVMVAFVNGQEYPDGGVCADDIDLYTSFGYEVIPAGQSTGFGSYCITGPALLYFHDAGQFRLGGGTGTTGLASAIAPAQGSSTTYDAFFNSAGQQVPVPDLIAFYNPGTGEGAALKIARDTTNPCADIPTAGDPLCQQDAFYYVDDVDRITGSTALGQGSGRRVASDIQGNACQCRGLTLPFQSLAPAGLSASGARCDEFFRGGRIDYVFIRQDSDAPFPQLLWRVTDSSGATAHNFDSRAQLP